MNWYVTKDEQVLITAIAERAVELAALAGFEREAGNIEMDVTAVHANGCPIDLAGLLAADASDFGHDVFGMGRYVDHTTGELTDCFLPRYAMPEPKTGEVEHDIGAMYGGESALK